MCDDTLTVIHFIGAAEEARNIMFQYCQRCVEIFQNTDHRILTIDRMFGLLQGTRCIEWAAHGQHVSGKSIEVKSFQSSTPTTTSKIDIFRLNWILRQHRFAVATFLIFFLVFELTCNLVRDHKRIMFDVDDRWCLRAYSLDDRCTLHRRSIRMFRNLCATNWDRATVVRERLVYVPQNTMAHVYNRTN